MIAFVDSGDPNLTAVVTLGTLKKTSLGFITPPINLPLSVPDNNIPLATIPTPNITIDTSKRKNYNILPVQTATKSALIAVPEVALSGVFGGGSMGFCTNYVKSDKWDTVYDIAKVGALEVVTPNYNDLLIATSENIPIVSLPLASTQMMNIIMQTSGVLGFNTISPSNLAGVVNLVEEADMVVGTFGDLTKCRNVTLSGSVVGTSDYILVVLNKNNDRIIHTNILKPGAWDEQIVTEDDTVTVIGVAKLTGKKSFAYKAINIAGVSG